jgi:hypothetical protein
MAAQNVAPVSKVRDLSSTCDFVIDCFAENKQGGENNEHQ